MQSSCYSDIAANLSVQFEVPDIILPTSNCIFLLESPHIQELKYGAPVSGSSGATMSKHIFGAEYAKMPLGILVKKNAEIDARRPRLSAIGLMNVSNIPLQAGAYPPIIRKEYADWFAHMNAVRTNNQKLEFTDPQQADIQMTMVARLRSKLERFRGKSITWIPCGRFAQKFFSLAGVTDPSWTVIQDVPHPSYNSWDREIYRPQIQRVTEAISRAALNMQNDAGSDRS
ncbi:hypothetical protein [Alicyclobacillus acidiphilus]|uniref:hypothetical protein n=1 Tax=Alicyclobacillus acidiphilus TaxID=182455 RepID=UPI00082B838B|nr:hypothetical protein [Alicyclobacillus acidiphilus]